MSRFCSECGTKIPDGVSYCPECGTPVEITAPNTGNFSQPNMSGNNPYQQNMFSNNSYGSQQQGPQMGNPYTQPGYGVPAGSAWSLGSDKSQ